MDVLSEPLEPFETCLRRSLRRHHHRFALLPSRNRPFIGR